VLTFANTTSGWRLDAASYVGANARHGPHHGAHQSTSTIPSSIVLSNEAAVTSMVAMITSTP